MSLDGKIKPLLLHKDTRSSILSAVIYQIPNLLKRSSSFALVIKSSLLKVLIPSPNFCFKDFGCLIFFIFVFSPNLLLKKADSDVIPSIKPKSFASLANQKDPENIIFLFLSISFFFLLEETQSIKFWCINF